MFSIHDFAKIIDEQFKGITLESYRHDPDTDQWEVWVTYTASMSKKTWELFDHLPPGTQIYGQQYIGEHVPYVRFGESTPDEFEGGCEPN